MKKFKKMMAVLLALSMLILHGNVVYAEELQSGQDSDSAKESGKIQNDTFWKDTSGNTIYSQGGGIFRFGDKYYWYGAKYKEAPGYAENPTVMSKTSDFESVTCYSSDDLVNWAFEGNVVEEADISKVDAIKGAEATWVGRLGVAKVGDKYVMLV